MNYIDEYKESLSEHIALVQEAGKKLGVCSVQLAQHDVSKWSDEELPYYAKNFFGGGDPVNFPSAWLHHIHHNPHHWQHWIFSDGWVLDGSYIVDGCLPMPPHFLREMVADWMGAGRLYTGSWDMSEWLIVNLPNIKLHPDTNYGLVTVLSEIGYVHIAMDWWKEKRK